MTHRSWCESQKRRCAARNEWKCGICQCILPSTYEVDHIIPLHRGGLDDIETNAMVCCPNCHRDKTQKERIQLMIIQRAERHAAETQARAAMEEDVRGREESKLQLRAIGGGVSQCSECRDKFYDIFKHTKCPIVENRINRALGRKSVDVDHSVARVPQAGHSATPLSSGAGIGLFEQFKYQAS
jgi:5-methylcytosine-specific restriction endonuclease McrA